jgi:hypothetical protein
VQRQDPRRQPPDEGWSVHPRALGAMSLHSIMEFSPDDISGFTALSGDNTAGVTLPFSVTIDGVAYNQVTIGSNGISSSERCRRQPDGEHGPAERELHGPTVFWMWDDLVPEGATSVRTVGTAPNRTFIVDFQENRVATPAAR